MKNGGNPVYRSASQSSAVAQPLNFIHLKREGRTDRQTSNKRASSKEQQNPFTACWLRFHYPAQGKKNNRHCKIQPKERLPTGLS